MLGGEERRLASRIQVGMEHALPERMDECPRRMEQLELVLLRRGLEQRQAHGERCARCRRTPLLGERVFLTDGETMLCALCRMLEPGPPARWGLVHATRHGQAIRIDGRRAA
jgi:hypothetical protein